MQHQRQDYPMQHNVASEGYPNINVNPIIKIVNGDDKSTTPLMDQNDQIITGQTNKKQENSDDDNSLKDEDNLEDFVFPGQKYPTPTQGDPTRAFYESRLEQKPDSLMALKWCIDYGCMDHARVIISLFIFNFLFL